ncbi:hypothetical protein JCM17478_01070 [Thermopirellula anaerolimosa]|jgi:hypothetical protein
MIHMATIVALADAVVSELNGEGWSLPFAARRLYRPRFEPADLKTLQVSVVPRSLVIEAASRADDSRQYQIDIAVQQKLDADPSEEIDPLLGLVEEIARHFRLRRPAAMPTAVCVKVENDPVYAVEHLDELRCFTSIITLSFRMVG